MLCSTGSSCAGCHALIQRTKPHRINVVMTPVTELGTDPTMARNATQTAKSGPLQGSRTYFLVGDRFGPTAVGADLLNHVIVGAILDHPLKSVSAITEDLEDVKFQLPKPREAYKARPLDGIWATAPYLHNGSVPSLWQLLQPEDQRIKSFYLSTTFDPVNVGFDTAQSPGSFELDTTLARQLQRRPYVWHEADRRGKVGAGRIYEEYLIGSGGSRQACGSPNPHRPGFPRFTANSPGPTRPVGAEFE